jgi:hypothetical protein
MTIDRRRDQSKAKHGSRIAGSAARGPHRLRKRPHEWGNGVNNQGRIALPATGDEVDQLPPIGSPRSRGRSDGCSRKHRGHDARSQRH